MTRSPASSARSNQTIRSEVAAKKRLPRDAELAERVVRAIHAATAGREGSAPRGCVQWAMAVEIRKALGASEEEFNRALAFGVSGEWLNIIRRGAGHSI